MKVTKSYLKQIIAEELEEAGQSRTDKKYSKMSDDKVRGALRAVSGQLHDAYREVKKNKGDAEKYLRMWEQLSQIYTEAFGGDFGTKPGTSPGASSAGGSTYFAGDDRGGGSGYSVPAGKGPGGYDR